MSASPINITALLKKYDLRPKKSLGQNFLVDPVALERVVSAAEVLPQETVLEIGAGLGSLTLKLAESVRRVVAVEIDRQLFPILRETLSAARNIDLRQGDILEMDPGELIGEPDYLVVANIPYYITSAVIRHLLEARHKPRRIVLTVQREVAQRITAGPGEMSLLALSVQVYGKAVIAARIPAGAFYPPPNVDSAVVRVDLYDEPAVPSESLDTFFRLIKAGFSQRRKTLRNTLSAGLRIPAAEIVGTLESCGINPQRRAETLSLEEWGKLVQAISG